MFTHQQSHFQQPSGQGQGGDELMFPNSGGHGTERSPLYTSRSRNGYPPFFSHLDEKGYVNPTTAPTIDDATLFTSLASQFNFFRSWIGQHHHLHQADVNSAHNHLKQSEVGYQHAGGFQTYPPTGYQFGSILEGGSGFGQVPSGVNAPNRFGMFQTVAGAGTDPSAMVGYSGLFQRLA